MVNSAAQKRIKAGLLVAVLGLAAVLGRHYEGNAQVGYLDRIARVHTPTACIGHTGPGVVVGKHYSAEQCEAWFREDLRSANAVLHSCVHRTMPVNVEAALTDFTFNVGPGRQGVKDGMCVLFSGRPSTISVLANAGDWAGVCRQFPAWDKNVRGLQARRAEERALCEAAP